MLFRSAYTLGWNAYILFLFDNREAVVTIRGLDVFYVRPGGRASIAERLAA